MKSVLRMTALAVVAISCWSAVYWQPRQQQTETQITDETPLWDVLMQLGKIKPSTLDRSKQSSPEKGKQLLETGTTVDFEGRQAPKLSNKFVCTTCHTIEREHFSAVTIDPQQRLLYSDSMHLPFLPGAPLYGVVNRILFFNDDFQTKYKGDVGALFRKAHVGGLREAIQTCNQTFAQGRVLKDWEVESILAYFWTMELRIGDLKLEPLDLAKIQLALETDKDNARAVNLLRRYYNELYPSHLTPPMDPEKRRKTSPVLNSFTNGWRVYRWSCLHCHQNRRYSKFKLDVTEKSFVTLKKHFDDGSRQSMYDVIRFHEGSKGNHTGMPLYTSERMSDQQIQDLRFFIIQMANMGDEAFAYYRGR